MGKLKYLIALAILFLSSNLFAQRTVTLWPYRVVVDSAGTTLSDNTVNQFQQKTTWTEIDSNDTVSFYFRFTSDNNYIRGRNPYSGYETVIVWADTSVLDATGTRDSVKVDVIATNWDAVSAALERSAVATADDSINAVVALDWGAGHSDDVSSLAAVINFGFYDGCIVQISNTDAPLLARPVVKISEDSR